MWTKVWHRRSPGVGKDRPHTPHLWGLSCMEKSGWVLFTFVVGVKLISTRIFFNDHGDVIIIRAMTVNMTVEILIMIIMLVKILLIMIKVIMINKRKEKDHCSHYFL